VYFIVAWLTEICIHQAFICCPTP